MGVSPPPTPPPRRPARGENRFKPNHAPCEWVESYYPGSYHPVNVGDVLRDGQYKVLRKLGYGSFSTVWLVHDLTNKTYVVLKIVVAKLSSEVEELPEVAFYAHLARKAADEGESQIMDEHIVKLLDTFQLHGPNGKHKCIVFEPMGPTLNSMVKELPRFKSRRGFMKARYPVWMVKQIMRGALEALLFLHVHGIAHGDVQPGNMLFPLRGGAGSLDNESESALWHPENPTEWPTSITEPIERLDGKPDRWSPNRLYIPQPLAAFANHNPGFRVKLSDLGGAYYANDIPAEIVTPTGLRAPELIFRTSAKEGTIAQDIVVDGRMLDVWSVGCLLFELVTGRPLLCVPWENNQDETDDDHLLQLSSILGPLPDRFFSRWTRSSLYFREDVKAGSRTLYNYQIGQAHSVDPNKVVEPVISPFLSMEDMFDEDAPEVASAAEAQQIKQLVRRILQYDPAMRPTVAEILTDAWFTRDDW